MQTDISKVTYDNDTETVTMPLDVYLEIRQSLRAHGETDLVIFPPVIETRGTAKFTPKALKEIVEGRDR